MALGIPTLGTIGYVNTQLIFGKLVASIPMDARQWDPPILLLELALYQLYLITMHNKSMSIVPHIMDNVVDISYVTSGESLEYTALAVLQCKQHATD